ncbi:hypothetical protein HanXRQr2_Chr09g0414581 [Helianthus annuus]|uniref:Secreted protein n=1 Tax=Helianthus annuus TaxID=4232 RepID=A0A9K3IAM8_HELAN|nr:hypothetical protein HanXRQr2_Chr09g0414581 [Helianthus annuus]KAJ0895450.1 hypothetical protein HanPSC8_Chr09g0400711 [Helianthus annuus]
MVLLYLLVAIGASGRGGLSDGDGRDGGDRGDGGCGDGATTVKRSVVAKMVVVAGKVMTTSRWGMVLVHLNSFKLTSFFIRFII